MSSFSERPHVLVIANAAFDARLLAEALDFRGHDPLDVEICVVAPARRHVQRRLAECGVALEELGIAPYAWIGDPDPLVALDEALERFPATEIVLVDDLAHGVRRSARAAVEAAVRGPLPVVEALVDEDGRAVIVSLEKTALLAAA